MKDVTELVTDAEIAKVIGNANFGEASIRNMIKWCLMKNLCGFSSGYTITCICQDLGLLGKTRKVVKKGYKYLWAAFRSQYEKEL